MDWSWITTLFQPAAGVVDTALNYKTAQQNLAMQQQQFEYQQQLNNLQMEREDTAWQRSVADMQKAGLSPLNASASQTSGLTAGTAPQRGLLPPLKNAPNIVRLS